MAKELSNDEVTTKTSETSPEATAEIPTITAGDLTTVVRIIDAGSTRGAWKGEELAAIGSLRTKLITVLQAIAPETVKPAKDTVEAEDDSTDESAA